MTKFTFQWRSSDIPLRAILQEMLSSTEIKFWNYLSKISIKYPRGQSVKKFPRGAADCSDIRYLFETLLQLKICQISFAYNFSVECPIAAKFCYVQNTERTEQLISMFGISEFFVFVFVSFVCLFVSFRFAFKKSFKWTSCVNAITSGTCNVRRVRSRKTCRRYITMTS